MSLRNLRRRHVIADDPTPELSTLDRLDLERSMTDHPAGKRRPVARPAPELLEEALADDDLLAVARGAGVLTEYPDDHPGWARLSAALIDAVEGDLRARAIAQERRTSEALIAYQRDGDAAAAMRVFRGAA